MFLYVLSDTECCQLMVMVYRYGFDYGCIHFVMMSTEHDYNISSKQHTFLEQHMQAVNRSVTPWMIFSGHRLA